MDVSDRLLSQIPCKEERTASEEIQSCMVWDRNGVIKPRKFQGKSCHLLIWTCTCKPSSSFEAPPAWHVVSAQAHTCNGKMLHHKKNSLNIRKLSHREIYSLQPVKGHELESKTMQACRLVLSSLLGSLLRLCLFLNFLFGCKMAIAKLFLCCQFGSSACWWILPWSPDDMFQVFQF